MQVSGKGKGRGKGKNNMKRKASVAELGEVFTPPPIEKEAPASDPLQKKCRGRRTGKGNKQAKTLKNGKGSGSGKEAAAKEFADDEKQDDDSVQEPDKAAEEFADDEKHDDSVRDKAAEEFADDEKHDDSVRDTAAEEFADDEKQDDSVRDKAAPAKGVGKQDRRSSKTLTPEQMEAKRVAMEKSQAVADRNLVTIRSMANQHPELQPQLGFTAKRLNLHS